jgi:hypothetical protein
LYILKYINMKYAKFCIIEVQVVCGSTPCPIGILGPEYEGILIPWHVGNYLIVDTSLISRVLNFFYNAAVRTVVLHLWCCMTIFLGDSLSLNYNNNLPTHYHSICYFVTFYWLFVPSTLGWADIFYGSTAVVVLASSSLRLRDHTLTHPIRQDSYERGISPSHRDLPDNKRNTHKRQTSMPPAGFEPIIPASERPQSHPLDRAATGIGHWADSS